MNVIYADHHAQWTKIWQTLRTRHTGQVEDNQWWSVLVEASPSFGDVNWLREVETEAVSLIKPIQPRAAVRRRV